MGTYLFLLRIDLYGNIEYNQFYKIKGGENMVKDNDGTVRYFTVAEAKRIQTFPDDYKITGAWSEAMRQLGNAVPVRLAKLVAQSVTCMI